jgi:hypothetical protein
MREKRYSITIQSLGFGAALAMTISWSVNKSILWAIFHGIFSWLYVLYFAVTR